MTVLMLIFKRLRYLTYLRDYPFLADPLPLEDCIKTLERAIGKDYKYGKDVD